MPPSRFSGSMILVRLQPSPRRSEVSATCCVRRSAQLGSDNHSTGFASLVEEVAYVHWHRMLFARFLAENDLLMHPLGVPVTLEECEELAPEEGDRDKWETAARYAGNMLPGIFSADDPSVQVRFAPESRASLEAILSNLPGQVFTSDDGLGWTYQFWQSQKKNEVSSRGLKIEKLDLAAYSQLFTEDYMVRFLLENSLGAWWAARHPSSPLVNEFKFLRFLEDGTPAVGTFPRLARAGLGYNRNRPMLWLRPLLGHRVRYAPSDADGGRESGRERGR